MPSCRRTPSTIACAWPKRRARPARTVVTFLALLAVALCALAVAPAARAKTVDLLALQNAIEAEEREAASLDEAILRQRAEVDRIAESLGTAGRISAVPATIEDLRQAQFEVDITRTRLVTLDHRISEQMRDIAAINTAIVQRGANVGRGGGDTLGAIVEEAALGYAERQRGAAQAVLERLQSLRAVMTDTLSWRQEQLAIAQRATSLATLVAGERDGEPAAIARLRAHVDSLVQRALALSNEASAITDTNPTALARRNALRVRADELTLRSNARLTDVAIVQTRDLVRGIRPLVEEDAVPVRIFEDAEEALATRADELRRRMSVGQNIRAALDDLSKILRDTASADTAELPARIARLRTLLDMQDREITALQEAIVSLSDTLARTRVERERGRIFVRETARTDSNARARIAAELAEMPDEIGAVYGARLAEVRGAVDVAAPRELGLFAAAALGLLALTIWLRQRVLKRFVTARAAKATEIPLEVLRRNLFWLFPPALWYIRAKVFRLSSGTATSVLTLLLIPAAAASLTDLTKVIVARRPDAGGLGRVITRATTVAMILTAAVVFVYVILAEASLLPSTRLAINQLAYSVFVLAGLPMLLFVLFFAKGGDDGEASPLRILVASVLALLPPIALIATGIAGLAGYRELAAIMLLDLATATVIAAMALLVLGIINDLLEGIGLRIRENDPARAYFVRQNFLNPAMRLSQLVVAVAAIGVAARVFEWSDETVGIRETLAAWRTPLFTAGGATYSVGNMIIALAAFAFVFWASGWSRRITYSVLLRKLRDVGIRQSLSVFAQYVIIVIGVLITLSAIGFDVTTLTVFAASLGVGIGFGLQNVVNNFISGVLLLVERPLRVGDIITVAGASGTVSQIGIRSMRMRTFDEFDLIVPNSALVSDTFTNWTRSNTLMRVVITVGISYADPPERAIAIIEEILAEHPGVARSPAPMVTVDEFGNSSVDLRMCYYIDLMGSYSLFVIRSEVLTAVRNRFAEEGLTIPFPQRDVHLIPAGPKPVVGERSEPSPPRRVRDEGWVGDAVEMASEGGRDGG